MASPNSTMPNGHTSNGHPPNGTTNAGQDQSKRAMPMRHATIGDIAKLLNAELVGDAKIIITGVGGLENAEPGSIAFIEHERLLKTALSSGAAAIIVPDTMAAKMRRVERKVGKPAVLTGNPRLAFAKVMEFLQPSQLPTPGIHPTAIVEPDAYLGEGVTVREHCYIGHHAHIGNGVVIYPHVVIGDGAQIGDNSILYPSVVIAHHVNIGQRVRIHSGSVLGGDGFGYVMENGKHRKVPQVGTVIIEDDVEIGANVCIDRATMGATRVGAGTKIDNLVQVAHNVQIGRNCILCGQVGLSGSVIIEDDAVLAGQAGLRDHVKIGKGATLGAKAGIMNDVKAGDFVTGSPAVTHKEFLRMEAAARKLPDALRTLRSLERQVRDLQVRLGTSSPESNEPEE